MIRWIFTLACIAPVVAVAADACAPVPQSRKTALCRWVQLKYRLPEASTPQISEVSQVSGSCYRKLHFVGSGKREFDAVLYLTPDQKYLVPELNDLTADPIAEEQRQKAEMRRQMEKDEGHAWLGPARAPVTVVVFSAFECPYCRRFAETLRQVAAEEKRVRFLFRNLPLEMHPWAKPAAEIAACVERQSGEAFWRVHDYLFEHQQELTAENLTSRLMGFAGSLRGVHAGGIRACVEHRVSAPLLHGDAALAAELHVSGTPTVFVNGERLGSGAPTREHLLTLIREALPEAARR
jgi:protein-disulfide isomerase